MIPLGFVTGPFQLITLYPHAEASRVVSESLGGLGKQSVMVLVLLLLL